MEKLSFTYALIDVGMVSMIVYGFFTNWKLVPIGAIGLMVYPYAYEPMLKAVYSALESWFPGVDNHDKKHQELRQFKPLVYSDVYNLRVMGIEKRHPFDASKYGRVMGYLRDNRHGLDFSVYAETDAPDYKFIYSKIDIQHLLNLNFADYIAKIAEVPLKYVPASFLRIFALRRFLYATQGSMKAACLAMENGMAINIGGGYHHAHRYGGSGFCYYNDIGLVIEHLWKYHPDVRNILIVDLDAHQGNGHEKDKAYLYQSYNVTSITSQQSSLQSTQSHLLNDQLTSQKQIFIIDIYNPWIFPGDSEAKKHIDLSVHVDHNDDDESYLRKVNSALIKAQSVFNPDFIIYNAGTDILIGDQLGNLRITPEGVIQRDEAVFRAARRAGKPILMLLSGGYQRSNAQVIAQSIINLATIFPELTRTKNTQTARL